jgi:hypothetical protein
LEQAIRVAEVECLDGLSDDQLGASIASERSVIDRLEADNSRRLALFKQRGGFERSGAVDMVAWLKQAGRMTGGQAADRVRVADNLESLPEMAQALRQGDISFGQASVITRAAADVGEEDAARLEHLAVEAAAVMGADDLRRYAERLTSELNQRAFLDSHKLAFARRRASIGQRPDGLIVVDMLLDPEGGTYFRTAVEALMVPPTAGDTRSAVQRRADAAVEMARRLLRGGSTPDAPALGGRRSNLILTATVESLRGERGAPAPVLNSMFAIPIEAARRIACDASITPLVVDGRGDPLELGRTVRAIPAPLRRALVARDKGCCFRGCDRPPDWCDGHHLVHWVDGGETSKSNTWLFCTRHHRLFHEGGWKLVRGKNGGVEAVPP